MNRIGIDLGGTKIAGVLVDSQGHELARERCATPSGDYAGTVRALVQIIQRLTAQSGGESVRGVGIGTPGVSRADGRMTNSNSQCLNDQPLLQDLQAQIASPLRLANDADCFALSEVVRHESHWRGSGLLFGVILGTGVGGGWVHAGDSGPTLVQGPNQLAGEWGHTPLPYLREPSTAATLHEEERKLSDRACYCGRLNCIETFLSGPGLTRTHFELWAETYTAQNLAQIVTNAGDFAQTQVDRMTVAGRARASLQLYQVMLARALAQVVNQIDPACIVLGGGLSEFVPMYAELPAQCARWLFGRDHCATPIRQARGGPDSGLFGAANLFSPQQ